MTTRLNAIRSALADREAVALVHAGPRTNPNVRYLLAGSDDVSAVEPAAVDTGPLTGREHDHVAVAVCADDVLVAAHGEGDHPASRLADRLATRSPADGPTPDDTRVLAPASIPHDAALYVERAGFDLASTDVIDRARGRKDAPERRRIEAAQRAAGAGLRRGGVVLAEATRGDDGLRYDGAVLSHDRLRRAIDAGIVEAGGEPTGATRVIGTGDADAAIRPGEPLVVRLAPSSPEGYRGYLARTLVPGTDGGWERRAHVAAESALRSAKTMLAAETATVRAVERELVAEAGSFGFERAATGTVAGVGLTVGERPVRGGHELGVGRVVALDVGVASPDGGAVVLGDLLAVRDDRVEWLERPPRTLEPSSLVP
ncbi:M24 family metallopeptidase [Halovivax cerinus]|uniref:M24 family metallopeptidase n=1 Tax=Halovivax cerinus TaxID=1487865 RepID=A0ABD5NPM8_9EURY|nr:M24 family metallopeptidase [Halovivax cerinus]